MPFLRRQGRQYVNEYLHGGALQARWPPRACSTSQRPEQKRTSMPHEGPEAMWLLAGEAQAT